MKTIARPRECRPRPTVAVLALFATMTFSLSSACGNLTAGGFGEIDVTVSGDAPDAGNSQTPPPSYYGASSNDSDTPEGEMEAEFTVSLLNAGGSEIALSAEPLRVRLDVEGRREADALRATVAADDYTALRINFTDFEIEIEDGLIINGEPIVGDVEVELEDGNLLVERPLSLTVQDGDLVELLIDLNTATWLAALDPDLRTVAETIVANAISIVIR